MENRLASMEAQLAELAELKAQVTELSALKSEVAELSGLKGRMARVERRARTLFAGAAALAVGGLTLLFSGPGESQARPQVVRAPFRVVGNQGQTLFLVSQNGGTLFNDNTGQPLARIFNQTVPGDEDRGLHVFDAEGHLTAHLGVDTIVAELPVTARGLRVFEDDEQGGVRVVASIGEAEGDFGDSHGLAVYNEEGLRVLNAGVDGSDGAASFDVNIADPNGPDGVRDILRLGQRVGGEDTYGLFVADPGGGTLGDPLFISLFADAVTGRLDVRNAQGMTNSLAP